MPEPRTAKQILDNMPARKRERLLKVAEHGKQRTRVEQAWIKELARQQRLLRERESRP
jgi:hypothetical protein